MATAQVAPRWGESLFTGLTFKVMLTTSAYVFDEDNHRFRSSVTNEVVATGYTAGGKTITTSVAYDAPTNITQVLADAAVTWTGSSITGARKAITYVDTGNAATDPIVQVTTFDADESSTAEGVFTLNGDSSGIVTFQAT